MDNVTYDSFENSSFDGSINSVLWRYWDDSYPRDFSQENGILKFIGTKPSALLALHYTNIVLTDPFYYQAKLRLENAEKTSVTMKLHGNLANNNYWSTQCGIFGAVSGNKGWAFCDYSYKGESANYTVGADVDLGTWHTVRIEINPHTSTVTYYIDDKSNGSIVVNNLSEMKFSLVVGTGTVAGTTTAYFDYVEYGHIR